MITPRISFGLYRGATPSEVPNDYLHWLLTILDHRDRGGQLRMAIERELATRQRVAVGAW